MTSFNELSREARAVALAEAPSVTFSKQALEDGASLAEALVTGGPRHRRSQTARRLISGKGITLSGFPIENPDPENSSGDLPSGYALVRKGKQGVPHPRFEMKGFVNLL